MTEEKKKAARLVKAVRACTEDIGADMFLFSGPIYYNEVLQFITTVATRTLVAPASKVTVIMTTFGGDAHAAYRLARYLQKIYEHIRLLVIGPCKSAGTLIAISADEIAFGPLGELGPLDVQLFKKDELVGLSSGLDTLQTFALVTGYAFNTFETYMLQTIQKSGGTISTKTACEVASQLVTGLFNPLTAQIDPHKLSEVQRMMSIAKAYGQRLGEKNLKEGALNDLINKYPSHAFIIDETEAAELFRNVSEPTEDELEVVAFLEETLGCVWEPNADIITFDVRSLLGETPGEEATDGKTEHRGSLGGPGTHAGGKPGDATPTDDGNAEPGTAPEKPVRKRAREPRNGAEAIES
ncbi:MAG TPA: hypothetical protein VN493_30080 [Thermoanaerobaculia bacterium]|nr:hypothetical protein [Thermoanaerobaculia bacterium]